MNNRNRSSSNGTSTRRHRNITSPDEQSKRRRKDEESLEDDDVDGGDETVRMVPRHRDISHVGRNNINNKGGSDFTGTSEKGFKPVRVDELIGFAVPRKARSVLKRSRENSGSNVDIPKKMKANGSKQNPPEEELEFEIAEVLYGLRTQSLVSMEKESDIAENAYISNSEAAVLEFNGPTKTDDLLAISVKNPITNSGSGISSSVTLDFANLETPVKEFPSRPGDGEVVGTKMISKSSKEFEIDLMAPPPQVRSSPQKESDVDFVSVAVDAEKKTMMLTQDNDENGSRSCRDELLVEVPESKKARLVLESDKSDIPLMIKDRTTGLELNLEKYDRENNNESLSANYRQHQLVEKQVKIAKDQYPRTENTAQFSSLHLPMSVSSWPGGRPPIGYMAPLQGVVSMDGSQVPPTPVQPLFSQPRPKRCGTHGYIARNIHGMQHFMKMNPFWQLMNSMQDKGQGLPVFSGHLAKEMNQNQQQIFLQQGLPPGTPANMMHGPPAFMFPFNQQQAAAAMAAASVRPGCAPVTASTSASVDGSAAAAPMPAAMSLNYPNMPSNGTQYFALLQNNAYPFPIPAPNFSGTHPQPIPFFYPSQMIHPNMPHQHIQPGQQNPSISNSLSSQKHYRQNQSEQGNGNINGFSSPKSRPPNYVQNYGALNSTQALAENNNCNSIRDENIKQAEKHNSKTGGVEGSLQTFAMSFSSMNGSSIAHKNNENFQKLLETDKRTYQVMQAAAVTQATLNKKNSSKVLEEGKNGIGGDSSKIDEQRKGSAPKPLVSSTNDQSGSQKFVPNSSQLQNMQFQQQHFMAQFQKHQQQMQHQFVAANSKNKASSMRNGDRLVTSSPSTASKFPNTISSYPQNTVQSSTRIASQGQSLSTSSFKNAPQQQQQARPQQQSHAHISFGSGQKSQPVPKGQQPPQGVAYPTTSLSKGAAASPRTPSSNSQGNKASLVSSNLKIPSILGNPNNVASSNSSTKSLVQLQQSQQQLKQMANNQPQLFFSPAYMQTQPPHPTSNTANKTSHSTKGSCPAGFQVKQSSEQKQSAGNSVPMTRK